MARPWPMPGGRARCPYPERPDWSVLSAQGSVADKLGDHEQAPSKSSRLSRMFCPISDFTYALSKTLPQAETALQQAGTQHDANKPVRQNLALVLALEDKFASAEEVARRDLDAKDAATNVAAIRRMIAQSNTWKWIQELDTKPQSAAKTHVGSNIE
jgi:Flp pilus assembly protein TadD